MDKVLHCDCGFEARAADEEELVAEVQRHARETHGMALTDDEALLLTFQAELGQHGTVADSPRSATPDPSNNKTSNSLARAPSRLATAINSTRSEARAPSSARP